MANPVSTSVNKPNVAALVTVLTPVLIWAANRFLLTVPLTEGEIAMVTSAMAGAAAWIGVYFTTNNPRLPDDNPPQR